VRDAKQITYGKRDQGQSADPARLSLTLNNKGGKYSPRNAMSPLYGQIGRNTQMRVSVPAADKYLNLVGEPNACVSTPDTAALDITGDIDIRAEIQPNWFGNDNQTIIGKWETSGAQASWLLKVYQGSLAFIYSVTGSPTNAWVHTRTLSEIPSRAAIRVTLDADNGAGGRTVRWYTAPSIAGPWSQLGPDSVLPGTVSLVNTTAPLKIGPTDLTTAKPARTPFVGRGYKFEVRNGIDGTVVANPDFTAQAAGATSFSDGAGRVWTLVGGAEIRDREDRFVGEVSSWPQKWTSDESDVYVPVEANGILRRLGQGLKALDSTLRRRIPSGDPIAYWPMEESQYATRAYSPIAGVDSASVSGVEWASADDLPSSQALPRLKASGAMSAPVPVAPSGEWHVEFVYNAYGKAPEFTEPHAEVIRFSSPNGTVRNWILGVHKGSAMWRVWGYDAAGNDLVFHTFTPGDVLNEWMRLRFWAKDNGDGTFNFRIGWQDTSGEWYGYTQQLTGTAGRLNNIGAQWGPGTEGWGIGHLSVLPVAGSTIYDASDDAFVGDSAWYRIMRLAYEENVPMERIHGTLDSARVGPQRPDTLINLLESAAKADGGFILETKDRVGLAFRDRSSMYTQAPALTLSYNSPGLAPDLEPIDDDSSVRNDIVVQRDGGSAGRAYLAEGPLSVQSPPLGIGVYDEQVTLSLGDDTQPEPMANWLLHLGTYDGARYPTVTVMLHKPGAEVLIPQILALRVGDMIRLTDLPAWLSHEDVDLIVEGYSETLDLYRWEITFNCSPGGPWDVAQVGNVKADTDGTVLATPAGTADTALVTQVTAGQQWVTNPAEFPFDVTAGGERMTVNSITSALSDTFTRTVAAGGWGTSDTGQPWVVKSGAVTDFDVASNTGRHVHNSRTIFHVTQVDSIQLADAELLTKVTMPIMPTGDGMYTFFMLRSNAAATNYYFARVFFSITGTAQLSLRKRNPTESVLVTQTGTIPHVAGNSYMVRFRVEGSQLYAKVWNASGAEPAGWMVTATDTDAAVPAVGSPGLRSVVVTANTNALPVIVPFDDIQITNAQKFNVTRSANGVVKPHPVGEPISLARPAIASL
jgi:hypothetical protein